MTAQCMIATWIGIAVAGASGGVAADSRRLVVDSFAYRSAPEIQAAWKAGGGSPPAEVERRGEGSAGVFRLPFTRLAERASWDREVSLDLANRAWFEVDLEIDDPAAVSNLTLFFRSGQGWYAAHVPLEPGRRTVKIQRAAVSADSWGKGPGPWSKIDALRISPWKGASRDAVLRIFRIEAVRPDVVLVQASSLLAAGHPEASSIRTITQNTARAFDAAGIEAGLIADTDIATGALAGVRVAVFPLNYELPAAADRPLRHFVATGGKLIAFYPAPKPLPELMGIRHVRWHQAKEGELASIGFAQGALAGLPAALAQDSRNCQVFAPNRPEASAIGTWRRRDGAATGIDAVIKSPTGVHVGHVLPAGASVERTAFLLALIGAYLPDVWRTAGERAIEAAPALEGFGSLDELARFLADRKAGERAQARLAEGRDLLARARAALGKPEAPALAASAHDAFVEAMARAFRPRPGEMRALWCHSAYGLEGMSWEETARMVGQAGFTAIIPNMLWAGVADYPSAVLPARDRVAKDGDQLAACLAAASRYNLEIHAWKVCWNLSGAPQAFVDKLRAARRLQVDQGSKSVTWLCPSHPDNFALERDSLLEVVRKYAVAGIHFDYIRYPSRESCYCSTCRAAFEKRIGKKVGRWPDDALRGALNDRFRQYRRDTITRLVRAVAPEARKIRPGVKISAAVFPDGESCRDELGQDWKLWVEEGLLDFICPMDYVGSRTAFLEQVRRQLAWAGGKVPVIPGLGVSVYPQDLTADRVVRMIDDARSAGAGGFCIFQLDSHVCWRLLPILRLGTTAVPAGES